MIDLTPLDIRQKAGDFTRGLRGYQPDEVDGFLGMVADRLEEVVRENRSISERISDLEERMTDYRAREHALNEALLTAQEMREEVREQSAREADLVRREAEQEAERIRARAVQDREREQEVVRQIRTRQAQLVKSYRLFLERELAELDTVADALDVRGRGEEEGDSEFSESPSAFSEATWPGPAAGTGAELPAESEMEAEAGADPDVGPPREEQGSAHGGPSALPADPTGLPEWLSDEAAGPSAGRQTGEQSGGPAGGPDTPGAPEGASPAEQAADPWDGLEDQIGSSPEQTPPTPSKDDEEEPDWLSELLREEP